MSDAAADGKLTPGIGNHWASIRVADQEQVKVLLVTAMAEGELVGEGNGFRLLQYKLAPEVSVMAVTTPEGAASTFYPAITHGFPLQLKLEAIRPDKDGYPEAELICRHALGSEVIFWDTHYALNSNRYKVGETYVFMVGGIAYKVEDHSDAAPLVIAEPEQVRRWRSAHGEDPDLPGPLTISMKGMGSLMPCNPADPDWKYPEYVVRGPAEHMQLPASESGYGLFLITVSRGGKPEEDLVIPVICHAEHILSAPKAVDGDVFSLAWLQGYLAE